MRNQETFNPKKQNVGLSAANLVHDGMTVGIGTGSTVAYMITELGRRIKEDGLDIVAVTTSYQSEMLAIAAGIPLGTLLTHPELDIAIDGADQVTPDFFAIKGGGAAHTKEKVVAHSANRFVIISDDSKLVDVLDTVVPLEVIPYALKLVEKQVTEAGGKSTLRMGMKKDGPVISDNGNFILDADFGHISDPVALSQTLSGCVGIVDHGIFSRIHEVHIASDDGVDILKAE